MAHATALPGRRQPGAELAVHELAVHGDGGEARGGGDLGDGGRLLGDGGRLLGDGARGAGSARRGWRWEDGAAVGRADGSSARVRAWRAQRSSGGRSGGGAEELGRRRRRRELRERWARAGVRR